VRSFSFVDIHLLVRAFIVYVRPIVEYNSVIWSPVAKHDIELVEKVHRRFTKRFRGLRNLSYCDRLTTGVDKGAQGAQPPPPMGGQKRIFLLK